MISRRRGWQMDSLSQVTERRGGEIHFSEDSPIVARALIGATILVSDVGGVIVETEAYDQSEPASHGYTACTGRTRSLFGPPGRIYVYLSYGIHWCLNVVCRETGHAAGVTPALDGSDITAAPFQLLPPTASPAIVQGPRIGITKALDLPWRFGAAHSPWLSHPFDTAPVSRRRRHSTRER